MFNVKDFTPSKIYMKILMKVLKRPINTFSAFFTINKQQRYFKDGINIFKDLIKFFEYIQPGKFQSEN